VKKGMKRGERGERGEWDEFGGEKVWTREQWKEYANMAENTQQV